MPTVESQQTRFIHDFAGSHRHVLDYLLEEVLEGQPKDVRDFMMQTSLLYRFNADLCNTITFRNDSPKLLDYLDTNNLFLVPLDDVRQWYRYHHLFADLLRSQLEGEEPDAGREIQISAARWHEAQGDHEQAIDYALAAGSYDFAAEMIQARLAHTMWQTALSTWQRWHRQIPQDLLVQYPLLAYTCLLYTSPSPRDA